MNALKQLFKLVTVSFVLFVLFLAPFRAISAQSNWVEVASNSSAIQFIDTQSIQYKKEILSVTTKYSEINPQNQETLNTNIYQIQIDCRNRLFKEQGEKWKKSVGNKLVTETIINSCTY
tara:strand:- start:2739 stop:3095 length:357 start_codon:yes stop_codon:yes gene_type:complete